MRSSPLGLYGVRRLRITPLNTTEAGAALP